MIDLHYWPTPNGVKITMFLEEAGLPYTVVPVDIGRGAQFDPGFLAISPNNRIPAIVDHAPADGGPPLSVFESGAILLYLAEKTGRFLPSEPRARIETLEWLVWQVAGLGPMAGQANHFRNYASEPLPYAIDRYTNEVNRLLGVLERRLDSRPFVAGEYSIADMAIHPWLVPWKHLGQDLADFPNVARWFEAILARPAVSRAREVGRALRGRPLDEEARKHLFGQTAATAPRRGG